MVGGTRIELVTPCVSSKCSTAELTAHTNAIKSYQVIKNCEKIKPFLRPAADGRNSPVFSSRQNLLNLAHEVAQVEGLGEQLGFLHLFGVGADGHGGEAGYEHDL